MAMENLKDFHSDVFLKGLQALLLQTHKDTQPFEIDGRSLDIPRVVAVARCSRYFFLP